MQIALTVRRILKFTAGLSLGLLLGTLAQKAADAGYFVAWSKLPTPPFEVKELITAGFEGVYVRSSKGETFRCLSQGRECWVKDAVPKWAAGAGWFTKPCDYASTEFFVLSGAPGNIVDCIQGVASFFDASTQRTYVTDRDNTVWAWVRTLFPRGLASEMVWLSLGGVLGLFVGLSWSRRGNGVAE